MHKTARPAAAPATPAAPCTPRQHARHDEATDLAYARFIASCSTDELARHDRLAVLRERHRARKAASRSMPYEPPASTRRPRGSRPAQAAPAQARRKRHADGGGGARPAQAPARERRSKPVADNLASKLAASPSMEGARTALELAYRMPGAVPLRCLFDALLGLAPAATAAAAVAAAHRSGRLGELVSAQASFEDGGQRIYDAYTAMADERRNRAQRATMASHTLCLDVVTSSSKGLL